MASLRQWLRRPWDQCRFGHRMGTKGGYTLCRGHHLEALERGDADVADGWP